MKPIYTLFILTFFTASAWASQDADLSINPSVAQFAPALLGDDGASNEEVMTLKNISAAAIEVYSVSVSGPDATEYRVVSENCVGTLAADSSCVVNVRYQPLLEGVRMASLDIRSSDTETPTLRAILSNQEDFSTQADRRLSPVLSSTDLGATISLSGQTVNWELLGYHDGYNSFFVIFDCTGLTLANCGTSFNPGSTPIIFNSGLVNAGVVQVQDEWRYNGNNANIYQYSASLPAGGMVLNDEHVVRFYYKSSQDVLAGEGSVSLVVPGNLGVIPLPAVAQDNGRRIKVTVAP